MDLGLRDSVAVVAASSRGIGRAVAEGFAREGSHVVINGRREAILQVAAEQIAETSGAQVEAVPGDVTKPEDCQRLVDRGVSRFGRIDVLITNAGGPPSKSFDNLTDVDWFDAVTLTLMSTVRLIRCALPHLRASRGSIVNITSIAAKQPTAGLLLSNALRPAVMGLSKSLAMELVESGIRVNDVGPGLIWSDRQEYLTGVRATEQGVTVEEVRGSVEQTIPMKRYGQPQEVANLVIFLASRSASYITGTSTLVDGGAYRGLI